MKYSKKLANKRKLKDGEVVTCQLCKREFLSYGSLATHLRHSHKNYTHHKYYDEFFKLPTESTCIICGKPTEYLNFTQGYMETCGSSLCINASGRKTIKDKYGVDFAGQIEEGKAKSKQTCLEKYGVDHPGKSDIIKDKKKDTIIKKYGVENYTQTRQYRDQVKATCLEKYGVDHHLKAKSVIDKRENTNIDKYGNKNVFQNEEIKDKIKQKNIETFGVENPMQNSDISTKAHNTFFLNHGRQFWELPEEVYKKSQRNRLNKKYNELINSTKYNDKVLPLFEADDYVGVSQEYIWKCLKCDNEFEDNLHNDKVPRCPNCFPSIGNRSKGELEIFDFLSEYIECESNKRSYYNKKQFYEIDVYIPELNIGIEYNGIYWHSELMNGHPKYHLNKTNYFKKQGIQIIHVFENEWIDKKEIVKSMLLSKIGKIDSKIYGRKCIIKDVTTKDKDTFLNGNHIQGKCNSSYNIGLYYEDELVSLATFSKSRFNKKADYELVRFCNKTNTSVIGAFSKLLKNFRSSYVGSILSYADLRYSIGGVYEINGFNLIGTSRPNYFYFKTNRTLELMNRINFQKHKLKAKLKIFDESLTEWENMQNNNYSRIWDCGNLTYLLE